MANYTLEVERAKRDQAEASKQLREQAINKYAESRGIYQKPISSWGTIREIQKSEQKTNTVRNILSSKESDDEYQTFLNSINAPISEALLTKRAKVLGEDFDSYRIRILTEYSIELARSVAEGIKRSNTKIRNQIDLNPKINYR